MLGFTSVQKEIVIKRISILAPNLSQNNLGRAYLLARVLQRSYEVEVLGPVFQDRIWPPVDDGLVPYITQPGHNFPMFLGTMHRLNQQISGDVVYTVKPRLSSFGIGLWHKRKYNKPLILDIDDWDFQGEYGISSWKRWLRSVARLPNPYSHAYLRLMAWFIPYADAITVVSSQLQARFGGVLVTHGRDTDTLNPTLFDRQELRHAYHLDNKFVFIFLGTPRIHKGIEDVLQAMAGIDDPRLCFMVVGVDENDPYTAVLQNYSEPRLQLIGMQPWATIPQFLAIADAVILAQRPHPFAQAQVPAKVFDGMAMAKPTIATAVGDLPQILNNSGLIVPPQDILALQEAMKTLMNDPELCRRLGQNARQVCQTQYSWDVMSQTLVSLIEKISGL